MTEARPEDLTDAVDVKIATSARKPPIVTRTLGQRHYVDAIAKHDIVFGIGPAGTGKTYLAVAMAVAALKKEQVSRIILTRPAVEAGEALGFLPGDLQEKITPYLRPLYDALRDMLEPEEIERLMARQTIEVAPLAYMRGRTLRNAFVILDEAQNTTTEQMFMFLTRIGQKSKCVVTGDVTQIDLPSNKRSGLGRGAAGAQRRSSGIAMVYFNERDVVRHELVRAIINAYQQHRSPANAGGAVPQVAHVRFPETQPAGEARPCLGQDAAPARAERIPADARVHAIARRSSIFAALHRRARAADFQRPITRSRRRRSSSRCCSSPRRSRSSGSISRRRSCAARACCSSSASSSFSSRRREIVLVLAESEHVPDSSTPESAALLAPYAFAPLVLSVLLGRNHGLYAAVFVSLWTRLLFGRFDAPLLACALISGFTAVFLTLQVRRRSRLIRAGFRRRPRALAACRSPSA